jgi:hypothetical protein
MAARLPSDSSAKAAISVSEMAKILGFSRNHFWSLCKKGVFPMPHYTTGPVRARPYFTTELQEACRQIRATNISHAGQFVLFYESRRMTGSAPTGRRPRRAQTDERIVGLVQSLKQLGLEVTEPQVESAVAAVFPTGLPADDGQAIRPLFVHLKKQLSG